MTGKVLILAGTREARRVCAACTGLDVLASLAGVTERPFDLAVPTRHGGFGGDDGFRAALDGVTGVLDATHPFAAHMTARTVRICAEAGVPYLRLTRAPWPVTAGWHRHVDAAACARALPPKARVLLTTGPGSLPAFEGHGFRLFCRRIDPAPARKDVDWIIGTPPFTEDAERATLTANRITHLVTKNSGGDRAKLDAATALGLSVHIIDRPAPAGGEETHDIDHAIAFVSAHARQLADHRD
ncbi:precorrin-6A/cobalt-precorrin-6A reductase [Jannaschia donghaensis]|uniref:Precorrin-6A reductase n=1 Tax=Jannaschia donghaensis TaxID=420998 RepID=A0A0M6YJK1_9RHOB|nr:precorrin-6A/cobalt-precorrin-6A reductase [Jannaschia donghaensis]CTQ50538.1 Precorrin-6A reductase [Jannaschia donghaensis]